jgi:S-adenosylmethionine synthetase
MTKKFITSESVTEGHPDKICDQISDAILDAYLLKDKDARVAVETLVTTGSVHIAGEVTSKYSLDIQKIVRETLRRIGYTNPKFGIDADDAGIWVSLHKQSPDIALGVSSNKKEQGAGDQGIMYGFASNETKEFMPLPIILAHKLTQKMAEVRKKNIIPYLGPDGKSQVTIEYEDNIPKRIESLVIAQQHTEEIEESELKKRILKEVINPVCKDLIDEKTKIFINSTGKFIIGGPEGDTGVTGRKIMVDSYGGIGRHGGGAFSGKDPSKVDRSGAYAARYIAKNIVASGLADKCEIQISYSIGVANPVGLNVECFNTNKISEEKILYLIKKLFPLKPKEIIERLNLKRPIYKKTSAYGHFGRELPEFTWEKLDMVEKIKKELKKLN